MESLALWSVIADGLDYDQLLYRWVHLIGGVLWLGMLFSFTLVHQNAVAALDPAQRPKVAPEYVLRTVFWFEWASLATWLTGVALLMKLYYSSKAAPLMYASSSEFAGVNMPWSEISVVFGLLFALYVVYELLSRGAGKHAELSHLAWCAVAVGYGCYLDSYMQMSNRAILIHIGALLGTTMVANVWIHISPSLRRSAAAVREGRAPLAADVERAGVRARHNLYMATPLLLLMVSVHQERLLGFERWQGPVAVLLGLGLCVGWALRAGSAHVRP